MRHNDGGRQANSQKIKTRDLVPQALNVANYALPSKLFSIMAAGRPFVCIAESGSPLDLLAQESGAGICVSPDQQERLFEAIISLAHDPSDLQAKGRNGRVCRDAHEQGSNHEIDITGF
jgi:colanic acid biosynthesis glycosyl transferase WcaI